MEHRYSPGGIQDVHHLIQACQDTDIEVPEDTMYFDPMEFPRFWLFCMVQMGRPFRFSELKHNATVVASIKKSEIFSITLEDLMDRGLWFSSYASLATKEWMRSPLLFGTMGRGGIDRDESTSPCTIGKNV